MATYVTMVNGREYRLTTLRNEKTITQISNGDIEDAFVNLYDVFIGDETTYKDVTIKVEHIVSIEKKAD